MFLNISMIDTPQDIITAQMLMLTYNNKKNLLRYTLRNKIIQIKKTQQQLCNNVKSCLFMSVRTR